MRASTLAAQSASAKRIDFIVDSCHCDTAYIHVEIENHLFAAGVLREQTKEKSDFYGEILRKKLILYHF